MWSRASAHPQKEINPKMDDTSYWKINMDGDCTFRLKFIRISNKKSDEEMRFLMSHTTIIKILDVTDNYYTFSGTLDSLPIKMALTDTIWRKLKNRIISN
jgi:hypothetical protein